MDTAVAPVQTYLHITGYFTVAEYPVLEVLRGEDVRSVTDLDILALRFAAAGHDVIRGRGRPALGVLALIEKWGAEEQGGQTVSNGQEERSDGGVRVHRRS